jgi:hypothetical protein
MVSKIRGRFAKSPYRRVGAGFLFVLLCLVVGCRPEEESRATATVAPLARVTSTMAATLVVATERPVMGTAEVVVTPLPVTETPSTPTVTPTPSYPVYQGWPLERDGLGVQIHLHREDLGMIMGHLQALGVGWVKVQVSWKVHQPRPEELDEFLFEELDNLVAQAEANDIQVLIGVAKAPEWSRPTTELDGPPTDYAHFRAFMWLLAGRYAGRVAAYELWNEPNLRREWNGVGLSAADFVALVGAGAAGVRSADPGAIVISGAPAPTGINDGVTAVDDRVYLREMVAAGVLEMVDAVGMHPYGWANPPDSRVSAPDAAVGSHNNHASFFFYDTVWEYRGILEENGRGDMLLWATEFGWGSFDGLGAPPPEGNEYMSLVSEWEQAEYTLRAWEMGQGWEWMGPMILWNLNFGPTFDTDFAETGYSLLRPDGSLRPVYLSLQAAAK